MIDCHYRRLAADGEFLVFESTDGARSNSDPEIQHGSPPLALMTKLIEERAGLIEERAGDSGLRIGRLTLDILGAIPVTRLRLRSWVERPGARVAARDQRHCRRVTDRHPPLVEGDSVAVPHSWEGAKGYLETVSWRRQHGADGDASVVWLSPLVPLVDSEPTTELQRLAMVVDSANGAGAALDPEKFVFMNTDTVMHLHRLPAGNDPPWRSPTTPGSGTPRCSPTPLPRVPARPAPM